MGEDVEKEKKEEKDVKKEEPKESKDKTNEEKEKKEDAKFIDAKAAEGKENPAKDDDANNVDESMGRHYKRELGRELPKGCIIKSDQNEFKVVQTLGVGEFGYLYQVSKLGDEKETMFVLKTDADKRKSEARPSLKNEQEALAWAMLKSCEKEFPKLIDKGKTGAFRYIVTEMVLSHNLADILKVMCKHQMPFWTAMWLAKATHDGMMHMHSMEFIHRDIRPHNFCIGLAPNQQRVYITGFGVARKYMDGYEKKTFKRNIFPLRAKVAMVGSPKYCSRWCHEGKELTWKDDYESWLYLCLEFFHKDNLAWNRNHSEQEVIDLKKSLFTTVLQAKESELKDKLKVVAPPSGGKKDYGEIARKFLAECMKNIERMSNTFAREDDDSIDFIQKHCAYLEIQLLVMMKYNKTTELKLVWETMEMPKKAKEPKREDKDKSKMARKKKLEKELLMVMQEIEEADEEKEGRLNKRHSPDKRRRRSGRRKKRTVEMEDDYDDDDEYDDEEESSSEERRRRRKKGSRGRKDRSRDEESGMRKKRSRKPRSRDEDRKESKKRRKSGKRSATRSKYQSEDVDEELMKMKESSPKDKGGKRAVPKIPSPKNTDEKEGQKKESDKGSNEKGEGASAGKAPQGKK